MLIWHTTAKCGVAYPSFLIRDTILMWWGSTRQYRYKDVKIHQNVDLIRPRGRFQANQLISKLSCLGMLELDKPWPRYIRSSGASIHTSRPPCYPWSILARRRMKMTSDGRRECWDSDMKDMDCLSTSASSETPPFWLHTAGYRNVLKLCSSTAAFESLQYSSLRNP